MQWLEGYLLHRRAYRETSAIIEFYSLQQGRVSGVVKGVSKKNSATAGLLQPFQQIQLCLTGRSELKNVTQVEAGKSQYPLTEQRLFCGFYINELLTRVLPLQEASPEIYKLYVKCLQQLSSTDQDIEPILRQFELQLIDYLGYGIDWQHDASTGTPIDVTQSYWIDPSQGFMSNEGHSQRVAGSHILMISAGRLEQPELLKSAKFICRSLLQPILGDKPLKSRELFVKTT